MASSLTGLPQAQCRGSATDAPNLPAGFTDTFTSRYVDTGQLRLHAVVGGDGPPLLLVHGWPQNWYAWRFLMPALARDFRVVAVDQRGVGLSDKPAGGYDTATLANDLVALMDALGHERFALVGTDTGMVVSYAVAADHPGRVERLVVAETFIPGLAPSPPLLTPAKINDRAWHIAFNRIAPEGNEALVKGREAIYFGWDFNVRAVKKLPDYAFRYYIDLLASDPEALRGSFEFYRATEPSTAQNEQRKTRRLTLPVLAIGGAESSGESVANVMKLAADDVESVILNDCGHFVAEEAPEEMLTVLTAFLAPYRDRSAVTA